jgi:hypothetical protein
MRNSSPAVTQYVDDQASALAPVPARSTP